MKHTPHNKSWHPLGWDILRNRKEEPQEPMGPRSERSPVHTHICWALVKSTVIIFMLVSFNLRQVNDRKPTYRLGK